jgi:hypothetical protein
MRISSRNVHKEGNKSSDSITLEASGDVSESLIEEDSENISPTKGNVDDAYRLLLSENESQQKIQVAINFPFIILDLVVLITIYLIFRRKKPTRKDQYF